MDNLRVGDKVRVSPSVTDSPWMGKLKGVIVCLDNDGTIGVEVESEEKLGHYCLLGTQSERTENGWWFMPEEVELI